jgi:cell wall-associated NlpC family hydrolase
MTVFGSSRFALALLLGWLSLARAQAQVRRSEVIATAEQYVHFKWKPTAANVFHGPDADAVLVETPDRSFSRPGIRPGWWAADQVNEGMPYMWGGFSTLAEFKAGLRRGLYAGDLYTDEKRRLGDAAVSKHAIGIDCSGLVSRCWKLDRPYSTKELPALCTRLGSYGELKPGDILNAPDKHVLIFRGFVDEQKQRLLAYEAGSPPTWKVLLNNIPIELLTGENFQPLRYRKIRD